MPESILQNLTRQHAALGVLRTLLTEEFAHLAARLPEDVSGGQLAIQELIRQIAVERLELKQIMERYGRPAPRLATLARTLPEPVGPRIVEMLQAVDTAEQDCARQAEKNERLALGLYDQSKAMLQFIHQQIQPKGEPGYGKAGRYAPARSGAALVSGRC